MNYGGDTDKGGDVALNWRLNGPRGVSWWRDRDEGMVTQPAPTARQTDRTKMAWSVWTRGAHEGVHDRGVRVG